MDKLGTDAPPTRRPASTAVAGERRAHRTSESASVVSKPALDVSQHPAAVAYQAAHPKRAIPRFGPYLLLQTLGEGEFGKVKLGLHATWGEEVAVKLIRRGNVENAIRMSKVEREIEVLRGINHPNIVRLYDVIETDKYIGIVLEYASGGELFDHILAHRFLRERDACKLFAQLISGVSYIHQKKVVHRDLKLENLLLDRNRNVIITDFGFANRFEHRADDLMQTSCGSPCYAAPELVISEGEYVGSAVDIWSCGVILYAMLAGYLPFDDDPANPDGDNINLLYKYIVNTPLTFPDYVSQGARDLLARMLVPDPKDRATLATIMGHPWLAPYASQFQLSVEQLEQQAVEQQNVKRMAYHRQVKKKQAQQGQASQPQSKSSRTQSNRPAGPADDSSDLLYTSAASPSRRDRVGASAIVLPSPVAAPVDTEMLNADAHPSAETSGGERKSRGYRHTIQLEYDNTTRDAGSTPPVPLLSPVQPTPTLTPSAETPVTGTPIINEPQSAVPSDVIAVTPTTPSQRRSSVHARTPSRAAPPSAFNMADMPASARTVGSSVPESPLAASNHLHNRSSSGDMKPRPTDSSLATSGLATPDVRVSAPPSALPMQDVETATLNGGRMGQTGKGVSEVGGQSNGVGSASDHGHSFVVPFEDSQRSTNPGGDYGRSPVLVTPTTTESADLPTPTQSSLGESPRPHGGRSASLQVKPINGGTSQIPSSIGPVRNPSTTSSTTKPKNPRHSSKPVAKHGDGEAGNTSGPSSKGRKALSLMVEPFKSPFRTRTSASATPTHASGHILNAERKDGQSWRSAPPSNPSAPSTPPPSSLAPSTIGLGSTATSVPGYQANSDFTHNRIPAGPASATSKAKRAMNWFRFRALGGPDPLGLVAQTETPATPLPANTGIASESGPAQTPAKPVINRAGIRVHEGAVDQAMVTSGSPLEALTQAEAVLTEMGITFEKESEYKFRCLRPKKRKGAGSVGPLGGMNVGHVGNAASNGVDRRGLPLPPPSAFGGPGSMLRGLLRRNSAQPGAAPESETQPQTETVYGERTNDAQDEVRFFVELTRIDRLEGTYSIDVRRLKGNLRSYKFVYDTLRERCLPRLQAIG